MKKTIFISLLLTASAPFFAKGTTSPKTPPLSSASQRKIHTYLQKEFRRFGIEEKNFSVALENERQKFSYSTDSTAKIPASLIKIFVAASALDRWKAQQKWKTSLFYVPSNRQGTSIGNLYLTSEGNPTFIYESMWQLVNDFSISGIKTVRGNLIVDESFFTGLHFYKEQSHKRAYEAPAGAVSFNWNSATIYLEPEGNTAKVSISPATKYIQIKNKLTYHKNKPHKIEISKQSTNPLILVVSGNFKSKKRIKKYISINSPALWSGYYLKEFLKQRGVSVEGQVKLGKMPSQTVEIAFVESKPLSLVLRDLMKYSNNFIAHMLTFLMDKESPKNYLRGKKQMESFLKKIPNLSSSSLDDTSGLSRKNRFTAKDFIVVLNFIKKEAYFPEFLASLPIAGEDGTLERYHRFKKDKKSAFIRAKTGSLRGVTSLAGYILLPECKETLTISFLYNGPYEQRAKSLMSKFSMYLKNHSCQLLR